MIHPRFFFRIRQTILSARRKRTSGINREMGLGTAAGRFGRGARRRAGPGNGRGGLSRKTLNIVTNLESHTVGVRSKQELEEVEEEKRLAEEERRLKESLRQKVYILRRRVFHLCVYIYVFFCLVYLYFPIYLTTNRYYGNVL